MTIVSPQKGVVRIQGIGHTESLAHTICLILILPPLSPLLTTLTNEVSKGDGMA